MPGPCYFYASDLERHFGETRVRDVFCDNGKREYTDRLAECCARASRRTETCLGAGWSTDQIEILIREDEDIFAAGCELVMGFGMSSGRPQWNTGDKAPYLTMISGAEKVLRDYASGVSKSRAEAQAGLNPRRRVGKVSDRNSFMFAPSDGHPRRGGF